MYSFGGFYRTIEMYPTLLSRIFCHFASTDLSDSRQSLACFIIQLNFGDEPLLDRADDFLFSALVFRYIF